MRFQTVASGLVSFHADTPRVYANNPNTLYGVPVVPNYNSAIPMTENDALAWEWQPPWSSSILKNASYISVTPYLYSANDTFPFCSISDPLNSATTTGFAHQSTWVMYMHDEIADEICSEIDHQCVRLPMSNLPFGYFDESTTNVTFSCAHLGIDQ